MYNVYYILHIHYMRKNLYQLPNITQTESTSNIRK